MSIAAQFLPLFVFLMLTEGLFRKLLPGQPGFVILIKDGLLLTQSGILTLELFISKNLRNRMKMLFSFHGLLFAFLGLTLVCLFSTFSLIYELVDIQTYLLGFREYFIYTFVIILSIDYFQSEKNKDRIIWCLLIAAIIIDIIGLLQWVGVIDINLLKPIEAHVPIHSFEYDYYSYQSSVFDVPERYAVFNLFILITCGSMLLSVNFERYKTFLVLVMFLALISIFSSARRISFMLGIITTIIFIYLFIRRYKISNVLFFVFIIISGTIFILMPFVDPVLLRSYSNIFDDIGFYSEWTINDYQAIAVIPNYFFFGALGQTSPGALSLGLEGLFYGAFETAFSKAVFSLGVFGAFILFLSQILIFIELLKHYIKYKNWPIFCALIYMACVTIWNIKGGEYLVWAPLSMTVIGLAYASIIMVKKQLNQNQSHGKVVIAD